jgi:hypothetical protein
VAQADAPGLAGYVWLGVEHIASGMDHLAFLVSLILLAASLGELATLVTGFTVAHSTTLALAALGVLRPDATAVNALIGFSVALVCAENAWLLAGRPRLVPAVVTLGLLALAALATLGVGALAPGVLLGLALFSACHFGMLDRVSRPARLRALVAFAFGLVHGFGFSFLLRESLQFAGAHVTSSLLAFNVGVELGQVFVLVLAVPVLEWLFRNVVAERVGTIILSALVAHTAWHWMTERGSTLGQYEYRLPVIDFAFWANAARALMLLLIVAGFVWLLWGVVGRLTQPAADQGKPVIRP